MEGLSGVMSTHRGSLAGNPLGDLIFSAAMTYVLRRVQSQLAARSLIFSFDVDYENSCSQVGVTSAIHQLRSPSYVDDTDFPVLGHASDIVSRVSLTMSVIHNEFNAAGLSLNYSKGKTECMICFRGRGAKPARINLAYDLAKCISFIDCRGVSHSLRVVEVYKHVGSHQSTTIAMGPEVRIKSAMIAPGLRGLRSGY